MIKREIINDSIIVNGKAINMLRPPETIDIEKCHGNLLNMPFVPNNDATRMFMAVAFSKATVPLINPEIPIIHSTYNRDLNRTNFYKRTKPDDYKEVGRIYRKLDEEDPRYMLFYVSKKKLHILEHRRHLTFGENVSAYNNTGDGKYLSNTNSFSDSGLLCEGLNTMVAYANIIKGIEDSCIISSTYSERCKYLYVKTIPIDIKDNVVFTSLHDSPFPKFNVKKKDNIGISINSDKNYSSLISPKIHFNRDKITYLSSKDYFLGDMEIYYSMDIAERFNHPIITKMIQNDIVYNKAIYDKIMDLKSSGIDLDINARKFIDDYEYRFIKRAAIRDGSQEIDKLRLIFYFYKEEKLDIGSKLSGSYGDKVTTGYITDGSDDNPHYKDQFGRIIELIKPSSGIINRTNDGQCSEHSVNFLSNRGLRELADLGAGKRAVEDFVIKFVSCICKSNAKGYKEKFKAEPDFWKKLRDEYQQIYLGLNPFYYDLHIDSYTDLKNTVKAINPSKFITDDDLLIDVFRGDKFVGRGMVAPLYIRRAKQEGKSKESVRALDDEGSDGNNKKTDKGQRSSNNPVKRSEKDGANQSSVFSKPEMRTLEAKDKMRPMIAYYRQMGLKLKK